nr:bifunctional phosphoribosylaminoimidazolecarboxamide formyltransferase/IMP cyclohydrolase PurH [Sediminibacterium sp.]
MQKKIQSALLSVFYKDGIDQIARALHNSGVTIYSTGGTQLFLEQNNIPCVPVESVTGYPSILGGRVKTLHPLVFGGILGRRGLDEDVADMTAYKIPEIDLVIVDLYPFEETVRNTTEEKAIIEKIDIGGPSMIRAAAKNHADVWVVANKADYAEALQIIESQNASTTLEQRRAFAAKAFEIVMHYDIAIHQYFAGITKTPLRYGENPHQSAWFEGSLKNI